MISIVFSWKDGTFGFCFASSGFGLISPLVPWFLASKSRSLVHMLFKRRVLFCTDEVSGNAMEGGCLQILLWKAAGQMDFHHLATY